MSMSPILLIQFILSKSLWLRPQAALYVPSEHAKKKAISKDDHSASNYVRRYPRRPRHPPSPRLSVRAGCSGLLYDRGKASGIVNRYLRQHLPIESDTGLAQPFDQATVGNPVCSTRSRCPTDPESPVIPFLLLPMNGRKPHCPINSLGCLPEELAARASETFRKIKPAPSSASRCWCISYSGHLHKPPRAPGLTRAAD
jgi:hypothetical protein